MWHFTLNGLRPTFRVSRSISPKALDLASPSSSQYYERVDTLFPDLAAAASPQFVRELCFICSLCSQRFHKLSDKTRHMAVYQHSSTAVANPVCGTCDERFDTDQQLSAHERSHYKYNCPRCDFNATTIYRLREHEKVHKERIYRCAACNLQFPSFSERLVHVREHHPSRPVSYLPSSNELLHGAEELQASPASDTVLSSPDADSVTGVSRSGRKRFLPAKLAEI